VTHSPSPGKKNRNRTNKPKRANGRGSIYQVTKNGQKRWIAAIRDITGKLRKRTFDKYADAEDWLASQIRAREYGENTYAIYPKMTVAEFLTQWVETSYNDDQYNTRRSYRNAIKNHIVPAIGNIKAANLTSKTIESLLRDMVARKCAAGTINSVKATLSAAYGHAKRHGDFVKNPVENVKLPPTQAKPTKPIPKSDWEKIYRAAQQNPYTHARIEVAGLLGLRPGEALGLKWSDLNEDECTLLIERQALRVKGRGIRLASVKQKKSRTIAIPESTVKILLTHKRHQALQKARWAEDQDLIFPNSLGKLLDEKKDRALFNKLLVTAQVPSYALYQLRKTAFTNLASLTDLRTLMEFSGHSQISTVIDSYVFPTRESMKSAVNGMDKIRPVQKSN